MKNLHKLRNITNIIRSGIIWLIWDFSGLRAIYYRISPPLSSSGFKPAATFILWSLGIYVALYGISAQLYERAIDRIEFRTNVVMSLVASSKDKDNLSLIPELQIIGVPIKPDVFSPLSVLKSFLGQKDIYQENVEFLRDFLTTYRKELNGVLLTMAIFEGAFIPHVNFEESSLNGSNFHLANLDGSNFRKAQCRQCNFHNASLFDSNLEGADFLNANFQGARFSNAKLDGASFEGADLRRAILLDADQLAKVYTLFNAKLDEKLFNEVKKRNPSLFKKPNKRLKLPDPIIKREFPELYNRR